MLVCEAVLTEVVYFLREDGLTADPLFQLLDHEAIRLAFDLPAHWPRIRSLMSRYRQMDLADASVVAMTELHARSRVLTIHRTDFRFERLPGHSFAPPVSDDSLRAPAYGLSPLA